MNQSLLHRTVAASAGIVLLDLALWIAGQHQLLSPVALLIAGLIPLAIGIGFVRYFNLDIPFFVAAAGNTGVIAYASLGLEANMFSLALLTVPACALWFARRGPPWMSATLVAASGALLAAWTLQRRLDVEYALVIGVCLVGAGAAIARFYEKQGHASFAELTSIGSLLFVAFGALVFDVSAGVFFIATISVSLLYGLLASRSSLVIAVLLGLAAALLIYRRFEVSLVLAVVFALTMILAHYTKSAALSWAARLPLLVSIIFLSVIHPAWMEENGSTHLWSGLSILAGGQAFVLARQNERDHRLALITSAVSIFIALCNELIYFAGFGIGLTIASGAVGLLAVAVSKPAGFTILGLTALKLFAVDWHDLNGAPRVAIFIVAAFSMLLFAVRVKNTHDGRRENPGRG